MRDPGAERTRWLLGGVLSPIGWSVGFIESPQPVVLNTLYEWRRNLGATISVADAGVFPESLHELDPLATPWTTELVIQHGNDWTAYLNNSRDGGDAFTGAYLARVLGGRYVIVTHQPLTALGHASTQFQLFGPDGVPPLMYVRTVVAHAEDRAWSWDTSGTPQPFEELAGYDARLVRDRLTRETLVGYLDALGIKVDDETAFGRGTTVSQQPTPRTFVEPLNDARRLWRLDGSEPSQ